MKFQPGNPGGPGRPPKEKENAIKDALKAAGVTAADVVQVIIYLMNHGTSWRARQAGAELFLWYTEGKPTQSISVNSAATPDDWRQAFKDDEPDDDSQQQGDGDKS